MTARARPFATLAVLVPVCVAVAFFALPLLGLLARTPWATLATRLAAPNVLAALVLSLVTSLAATLVAATFGLPLAVWLARSESRARAAVRALVTLPMVLPPVVGGVALLLAYGRNGLLGLGLPFTTTGVVVAEVYVAMPFFVLTLEAGLRSLDPRYGEAAATLGAGPTQRFARIVLPALAPSLRAALVVCWARALGEFGATITFAGNLPGRTQTLPLAVYLALETEPEAAIALSLLLVAVSVAVLFATRARWVPSR